MSTQLSQQPRAIAPQDPVGGDSVRDLALRQIERRRRFLAHAVGTAVGVVLLVVIWATSEYNNAGGWPTGGFSQSSGIPHVWNDWIIYPVIGLLLILAIHAWSTYYRKPITERDIQREIERLTDGGTKP
jgi:glycerol uptake facilitator-like aquaporin